MSLFNLERNVHRLPGTNVGVWKNTYDVLNSTSDIKSENFSNGQIIYRWSNASNKWSNLGKSYLKIRCTLTKENGDALTISDNIAPSMNMASHLFSSAEFRINGKTVSRVADYLPQIDTVRHRMTKSKAWLDSVGSMSNFWQSSFDERQSQVCADGLSYKEEHERIRSNVQLGMGNVGYVAATGIITGVNQVPEDGVRVGDLATITASAAGGSVGQASKVIAVNYPAGTVTVSVNGLGADMAADAENIISFKRLGTNYARQVREFELTYQPPLAIWDNAQGLPVGDYELILTPQPASTLHKQIIESRGADKVHGAGNDFKFSVDSMHLHLNQIEGKRVEDGNYYIDLNNIRCQSQKIDGSQLSSKQFSVSPSSYAFISAYQDSRVGSNTLLSPSKLSVIQNEAGNRSKEELKLTRFYIQHAGQSKPSPDADPKYEAFADYTTERYMNTLMETNGYYEEGGVEDIVEYQERGTYHYINFAKDGSSNDTNVTVYQQFSTPLGGVAPVVDNMRVLLFDLHKQYVAVTISDGAVSNVELHDN